jgi:hypothetical protein
MTGENEAKEKGIGFDDPLRIKNDANKRITDAGMNSRELVEFTRVTIEEWQQLEEDYDRWKGKRCVKDVQFYGLVLLGIAAASFLPGGYKSAGLLLIALLFYLLAWREGHRKGFFEGYAAGLERGICKAFGIAPVKADDFRA